MISFQYGATVQESPCLEFFRAFLGQSVGQFRFRKSTHVLIPELEELLVPLSRLFVLAQGLQAGKRVAVFSGKGLDFRVDTVKEVSRACVWGLMTDVYILVFEEACLSVELRPQLSKGVTALSDPQFHFHQNQPLRALGQGVRR